MRYVYISLQISVAADFITEFGITSILFKTHIRAMSVGAVVGTGEDTRKASFADTVSQFRFQGVVGTISRMEAGVESVLLHLAGNDIHHATHGV